MKFDKHLIIKGVLVIFLIGYITALCLSDSAKNIPIETISAEMEAAEGISALTRQDAAGLKRFYGLDENAAEGYFFCKADSPMSIEEALIVKARSKTEAEAILEAAEGHLASQIRTFEGYGTDQMGYLNDAVVEKKGVYTYYFCGPNADIWRRLFLSMI
ncbi:MAG: DUF4358 domain-containing protein [Blautia sp.]|nr:DUF4358 domain-containing protein [Blautia sp.]